MASSVTSRCLATRPRQELRRTAPPSTPARTRRPLGSTPAATPSPRQAEFPFARLAHFRILRPIGHGGMGDVYEAYDESLHRQVAVKVLPADLARDETFLVRFGAEARAAAATGTSQRGDRPLLR